jgi:uncharacterized protein YciI
MFLLLSRYVKPLPEVERWLPDHRAFLDRHYAAGHFVVSGPLEPRTGGVIVVADMERATVDAILAEDPFAREGVSAYEILEFRPTKMAAAMKPFVATDRS